MSNVEEIPNTEPGDDPTRDAHYKKLEQIRDKNRAAVRAMPALQHKVGDLYDPTTSEVIRYLLQHCTAEFLVEMALHSMRGHRGVNTLVRLPCLIHFEDQRWIGISSDKWKDMKEKAAAERIEKAALKREQREQHKKEKIEAKRIKRERAITGRTRRMSRDTFVQAIGEWCRIKQRDTNHWPIASDMVRYLEAGEFDGSTTMCKRTVMRYVRACLGDGFVKHGAYRGAARELHGTQKFFDVVGAPRPGDVPFELRTAAPAPAPIAELDEDNFSL